MPQRTEGQRASETAQGPQEAAAPDTTWQDPAGELEETSGAGWDGSRAAGDGSAADNGGRREERAQSGERAGRPRVRGLLHRRSQAGTPGEAPAPRVVPTGIDLDLAANDPLVGYLLSAAGAVDITNLRLASPALKALQAAGVVLVVPLISSGSLVGLLSLGPRMSERGYSSDDLRLLNSLAGYAAPAMRVGQLVR